VIVRPHYRSGEGGRPPIGLQRMLRMLFVQHWFNLADRLVKRRGMTASTCAASWASTWAACRCERFGAGNYRRFRVKECAQTRGDVAMSGLQVIAVCKNCRPETNQGSTRRVGIQRNHLREPAGSRLPAERPKLEARTIKPQTLRGNELTPRSWTARS